MMRPMMGAPMMMQRPNYPGQPYWRVQLKQKILKFRPLWNFEVANTGAWVFYCFTVNHLNSSFTRLESNKVTAFGLTFSWLFGSEIGNRAKIDQKASQRETYSFIST